MKVVSFVFVVVFFVSVSVSAQPIQDQEFTMGWDDGRNVTTTLQEMVDEAYGKAEWCTFEDLIIVLKVWNQEIGENRQDTQWLKNATEWLEGVIIRRQGTERRKVIAYRPK